MTSSQSYGTKEFNKQQDIPRNLPQHLPTAQSFLSPQISSYMSNYGYRGRSLATWKVWRVI